MDNNFSKTNTLIKGFVLIVDLVLINGFFVLFWYLLNPHFLFNNDPSSLPFLLLCNTALYLFCHSIFGSVLHKRLLRAEELVRISFFHTILHALIFVSLVFIFYNNAGLLTKFFFYFYTSFFLASALCRILIRRIIRSLRRRGRNQRYVLFIGCGDNLKKIYHDMKVDPASGYGVKGYIAEEEGRPDKILVTSDDDDDIEESYENEEGEEDSFLMYVPYLGKLDSALEFLQKHQIHDVFCDLQAYYKDKDLFDVINYCENHFINFYSVPNFYHFLKRRMHVTFFGHTPILYLREEPLSRPINKFIKRTFDIVFSLIAICLVVLPAYLIIGTLIKLSSPGPILFKQKRTGLKGKEFYCYKFRSMKVNDDADKVQATKDDPRKTKIGEFIRKTSIDELPQFFNVLKGDMSVVGPRPHMLKHTEEYSELIGKYMIRHLVKPGITGWAQINGYRGETKELWQMKGRVKRDVWYIENWSFFLDLYIIWRTVWNAVKGEKEAY